MSDLSNLRIGNPTSSEIVALVSMNKDGTKPGEPFYTYVQECIMERMLKRTLENEVETLAFQWGKLCESYSHILLPNKYQSHSSGEGNTLEHKTVKGWFGTPDGSIGKNKRVVTEQKCPLTMKSFLGLVRYLYTWDGFTATPKLKINGIEAMDAIRKGYTDENGIKWSKHRDGEKYYWQIVSNACITGAKFAELIVFCPYRSQLDDLLTFNRGLKEPYNRVMWAKDGELPFIYEESGLKNINIIRFEVPQEDKDLLTERVKLAIELINK